METASYVALSGQLALDRRMSALAQNIANARTAGYRAEVVDFKTILAQTGSSETAFSSPGRHFVSEASGGLIQTKNQLDLAVKGAGFLAYQSPNGVYYSRDGRLSLSLDGNLLNSAGDALLDSGGGAIQVDPNIPNIVIDANGAVSQAGQNKGSIGMFEIDLAKGFQRSGPSGFVPIAEPIALSTSDQGGIIQGYYEDSNVDPTRAMTTLIEITRAFEAISNLSDRTSEAQKSAIDVLGSRN